MSKHLQTWEHYKKFADDRAKLVVEILQYFTALDGKRVLDFGCGEGATARLLAQSGAHVTAVDIKPELEQNFKNPSIEFVTAAETESYWGVQKYDVIVLQDVLEHLSHPDSLLKQLKISLRNGGLIYLSTPNRFAILNVISDPHWSLPGVALLPRPMVAFFVQKIFGRDLRQRADWPALFSLWKLKKLFLENNLELFFVNTLVVKKLFQNPSAVVCHPDHLRIVQWLRNNHLERRVSRIVNDRAGVVNLLLNPTWYVIGRAR